MPRYDFHIPVVFKHRVVFTRNVFDPDNPELGEILAEGGGRKALVLIEEAVATAWPHLATSIHSYFETLAIELRGIHVLPGGEASKADDSEADDVCRLIDAAHIDRHSYILSIGGGAFLDLTGYAAATAHRGVRLVRLPTTSLSQDDSGVGVKCAINAFGKKNWLGAFAVPFAVINDFTFLQSQPADVCRAGLIEAVKVAAVKDAGFFEWIENHLESLANLDPATLETCVEKSALLHVEHIAHGGDPFETGSSRPLDFGHWTAHKLEALTGYRLSHAKAVAIGMALDTLYSCRSGLATPDVEHRIFHVLKALKLDLYHPALDWLEDAGHRQILAGLNEFREHLGGDLTVMMLKEIGKGVDIHWLDWEQIGACIDELRECHSGQTPQDSLTD